MVSPAGLPPLFIDAPVSLISAEVVAEFPVNTFLENIAIDSKGTLFITSYEEGKIYRITLSGECSEFASIDGNVAGIAIDRTGKLLVAGSAGGTTPTLFHIDAVGVVEPIITLPEAIFLNGMTALQGDRYLVADSYKGAIWEIDINAKTAQIWIQDQLLERSDPGNLFPAVNGVKVYQDSLFASNTQRQFLIRIPLTADRTPETPEIFLENVNLDDFAFDVHGNLYGTTHIYNSVVRISPEKQITTLAEAAQGMTGSTALAFGPDQQGSCTSLYVTTNGGMSLPPATGVEPAKVVRLDVGKEGMA